MTAATTTYASPLSYPPGSPERRLYQRLLEISMNPAYSQGFRTLAGRAAHYDDIVINPADLSTDAIREALLAAAKKEHKAWKKRWRAGDRNLVPFPEIWKAFIDTAKNGCRFSKWCDGRCDPSEVGDRQHWSVGYYVHDPVFADAFGLQIFQSESSDKFADPAYLILSYYEGGIPCTESYDTRLTPVEARKCGEILRDTCDIKGLKDRPAGVLLDVEFASGDRLVVERHRPRTCKDGHPDREVFEISLWPVDEATPLRMRSDYSNPSWLGKYLLLAADDAEGVVPPRWDGWESFVEAAGR
ncbi:MAG: hypothetical protein ABW156_11835 [Jiangellaceae bacterium]